MEISTSGFKKKKPTFLSRTMKITPCSGENIQANDVKQGLRQKFLIRQHVFDKCRAICYGDTHLLPAMLGSF